MEEINPKNYVLVRDKDSSLYLAKKRSLFNINWEEQLFRLAKRNGFMPLTRDFADLVLLLESRRRVYDGRGKLISTSEKQRLLDETIAQRNPWRAENLDNRFFEYNGIIHMASRHRIINEEITPLSVKEINPLMQDGYISLKDLDEDGLATKVGKGDIYYIYPRNGSVAWFSADAGWAGLSCNGGILRARMPTSGYVKHAKILKCKLPYKLYNLIV